MVGHAHRREVARRQYRRHGLRRAAHSVVRARFQRRRLRRAGRRTCLLSRTVTKSLCRTHSPWPLFRRDERNTGNSPLPAIYHDDQPWSFRTGKGVFSTPVIDEHGVIYVGSADHNFYALNPDGTEKFRFTTGEIIDSAGALPRLDPAIGYPTVLIPSGDGHIYNIRTDDGVTGTDRLVWAFDARSAPGTGFNNWFEGNIGFNYDGTHSGREHQLQLLRAQSRWHAQVDVSHGQQQLVDRGSGRRRA